MENKEDTGSNLYFSFFSESDAAMAILDKELKILTANRKFENILEALPPKTRSASQSKRHFPLFWSYLLPLATGQHNYAFFEGSIRFQSGSRETLQWFNVHAWRIKKEAPNNKGSLIGLSLEDNTLGRQEEKKLLHDKQFAEKTIEAKDRFLANMSHEIRTPIQTIIGMTELLEETKLDHEQSEYSRQVQFSATVLLSLINDILDYSKIEAGKMALENIDFDLEQIIEQAIEMIALEAHKKELYIAASIPLETNIIMSGDPGKFRQIVINLVKNAVKFTKDGGIVVSVTLTAFEGAEGLCVSVADTGIGITEETKAKLFSAFVQADTSNSRRFGGTGLGLAISRSLVELMHGNIETVPNEGGGSIFRFTIPLRRSQKQNDPLPLPERNGKLKILVVDDCFAERKIIAACLKDLGYTEIHEAETGKMALNMMRKATASGKAYQMCFLDMIMPVMDGWRLAAEIHNDNEIQSADLILMVPHGLMGADAKMTLLKWFKAYINKPIKRRRLADTIIAVSSEIEDLEELADLEEVEAVEEESSCEKTSVQMQTPEKAGEKISAEIPLILIAEDHIVNQKLFAKIMDKLKYRSLLADNGLEAVEKTLANPVDLIFMDIQMPGMTGYEAAEILRGKGFKKPIIAVTASAISDEWNLCVKAGIDDIMLKPFLKADIEKMIRKWLNHEEKHDSVLMEAVSRQSVYFSSEHLLHTFMGEKELAISLLSHFINRTQGQIENIREYIETEDWANARLEAHTIKGAALTMGGVNLGGAAARMENAFKNFDRGEMEAAYPILKKEFNWYKKEAEKYIKSASGE